MRDKDHQNNQNFVFKIIIDDSHGFTDMTLKLNNKCEPNERRPALLFQEEASQAKGMLIRW